MRSTAPPMTEYRHPLARYSFRAVFADAGARGRFSQKDLGTVYSRDVLGEPGTLERPAPRLLADDEAASAPSAEQDRTLDELRFVPGDYLCVMVQLPKSATAAPELAIKGSAAPAGAGAGAGGAGGGAGAGAGAGNGWKGGRGDGGWGGSLGSDRKSVV